MYFSSRFIARELVSFLFGKLFIEERNINFCKHVYCSIYIIRSIKVEKRFLTSQGLFLVGTLQKDSTGKQKKHRPGRWQTWGAG